MKSVIQVWNDIKVNKSMYFHFALLEIQHCKSDKLLEQNLPHLLSNKVLVLKGIGLLEMV